MKGKFEIQESLEDINLQSKRNDSDGELDEAEFQNGLMEAIDKLREQD